jgi:hypothetical protein
VPIWDLRPDVVPVSSSDAVQGSPSSHSCEHFVIWAQKL